MSNIDYETQLAWQNADVVDVPIREPVDYYQIKADFAYLAYLKTREHTADGKFTLEDAETTVDMLATYLMRNRWTGPEHNLTS